MFSGFQNELYSNQLYPSFGFNTVLFENDFKGIFPELFLVLTILLLLIYGVVYSTSKEKKYHLSHIFIKFMHPIGILEVPFLLELLSHLYLQFITRSEIKKVT